MRKSNYLKNHNRSISRRYLIKGEFYQGSAKTNIKQSEGKDR